MKLDASPHVPFALVVPGSDFAIVVPLPCLQCILDAWAIRARQASRMRVERSYRVGTTNWALRPIRADLAPRFKPDK